MKVTVGIENKNGKLRLRLPRSVADGSSRYMSTGLDDIPTNRRKVQRVALEIEDDICSGNLDASLQRYLTQFRLGCRQVGSQGSQKLTKEPDIAELWDKYCKYMKPQLAITTYQRDYLGKYTNHIKSLPTKNLNEAITIRDYLVFNVTVGTAKRLLTHINACCKWAVSSGLVSHNPFNGMAKTIKVAKAESEIDPFTLKERAAILQAFADHPQHKHYLPFVRFLFLTGCRLGEAIALQWQHIRNDCNQITFSESFDSVLKLRKDTKTHKVRKLPCNQVLKELLLNIRPTNYQPDDQVFSSPTGLPIDGSKFTTRIWKGCRVGDKTHKGVVGTLVGKGVVERYRSPYNCRHTFITMSLEAGVSITQVAKWVGNSPEVILKHYAGIINQTEVPIT